MELKIVINDNVFKQKLIELKDYFDSMMKLGVMPPLYEDSYKPLKVVYDVVFNNEIMYGLQKKTATFWPIKDNFADGEQFLNSELGQLLQEVVYYFAYNYIIPRDQLGGYNIDQNISDR
jgi:hypothetical protein